MRVGEMAQWSRVLAALQRAWICFPASRTSSLQTSATSVEDLMPSSGSHGHLYKHSALTCVRTHTQIKINLKRINMKHYCIREPIKIPDKVISMLFKHFLFPLRCLYYKPFTLCLILSHIEIVLISQCLNSWYCILSLVLVIFLNWLSGFQLEVRYPHYS